MKKQVYTKPNIVPGDPDEIGAKPGFGWGWDDEEDM